MMNYVFIFSVAYVMGFIGLAIKPSPIYGGLGLIFSGCVGCGLVLNSGGRFLGLMVFLIYLGGMLVVFGYTTAMASEEYPETWSSNWLIFGGIVLGVLMELGLMLWFSSVENVELVVEFNNMGDWVVFEGEEIGLVGEDGVGVSAMYSCAGWMVVVAGWSLFVSIFIIIEITRGN
uniref:NADH-ubiquinone oxidoreductase chain 6 n=1 Tax=Eospalax rothschildi TaxID=146136 RepID=J3QZU3_EOSRO|nr:NADH dehydrogenase subunit 6 [Eospalax rothschildi]AEO45679.1 NADH dehydrogenase subunit 6 [Eospalax rothschildi]